MKCHIFVAVTILSLLQLEASSNPILLELKAAYDAANNFMAVVTTAKSMADLITEVAGQSTSTDDLKDILLERIDNLQNSLQVNIPLDIQQAAQIDDDLRQIFNEMSEINRLFDSYYRRLNISSSAAKQDFITKATSIHADGPDKRITTIANTIVPGELWVIKSNFFDRLVTQLNTKPHYRCGKMKSPQQYIFELYNLIGTIEFRAFTMMTTAYKMRSFISSADNELDIRRIKEEHENRMRKYLTSVKKALTDATTVVAHCQPTYVPNNQFITYNSMNRKPKYISLLGQRSDTSNNKVVTGIRFVVDERLSMLQLQIEEGKLVAGGKIAAGTRRWVPLQVQRGYDGFSMLSGHKMVEREHYEKTIYLHNYIHLQDVKVCTDCVVIGARIASYELEMTNVFFLILTYAKADMKNGVMIPNTVNFARSYYGVPEDQFNSRGDSKLFNIGTTTSLKYFDSSEIYTEPRSPLSGVGIYVAPDSEHGEALALRIHNADLATRIKTEL